MIKRSIILVGLCLVLTSGVAKAQSLTDRKDDYQRDLDIYRDAHAQFVVKKSEFQQFGTFASEEELITATRQVLLARDDVWITYWKLLSATFDTLSDQATKRKSASVVRQNAASAQCRLGAGISRAANGVHEATPG